MPHNGNPHITPARRQDSQYGAALYVFDAIGRGHDCVIAEGIDKEGLLRASGAWAHGEQVLIRIALDLFDRGCVRGNGFTPASIGEMVDVLDPSGFRTAVEAIQIARGVAPEQFRERLHAAVGAEAVYPCLWDHQGSRREYVCIQIGPRGTARD